MLPKKANQSALMNKLEIPMTIHESITAPASSPRICARLVLGAALWACSAMAVAQDPGSLRQKTGVTSKELFEAPAPGTKDQEVTVLDVTYLPGGFNPRHFHPAAVTFHVLSGNPVFQEEGKPAVTLKPGDSLFVPAGTTHSHWNPSSTEGVHWLEFIVAPKGKGRSIPKPN